LDIFFEYIFIGLSPTAKALVSATLRLLSKLCGVIHIHISARIFKTLGSTTLQCLHHLQGDSTPCPAFCAVLGAKQGEHACKRLLSTRPNRGGGSLLACERVSLCETSKPCGGHVKCITSHAQGGQCDEHHMGNRRYPAPPRVS
jgi:hypothetical protein